MYDTAEKLAELYSTNIDWEAFDAILENAEDINAYDEMTAETETPLGISVTLKGTTNADAFSRMKMDCEGITDMTGGNFRDDNGGWTTHLINGQGTLSDTMTIYVTDVETGDYIGDIVFKKK